MITKGEFEKNALCKQNKNTRLHINETMNAGTLVGIDTGVS
jgi:hypothetical protein